METCVIYARVSTDTQETQSQINDLESYSRKQNYITNKIFQERISGLKKSSEREELKNLLFYSIENKIDNILIWEISRLGRLTTDVLTIIDQLNENKINLFIYKDRLNTLLPDKKVDTNTYLLLSILSSISTNEVQLTKERSKRGLLTSAENGIFGGKIIPYGYKKDGKKLVIDDYESEIIKKIFNLNLEGNGTRKISNYLNQNHILTRYNTIFSKPLIINGFTKIPEDFKWVEGSVYSILKNPIYTGFKRYKTKLINLPHLRIIDDFTFNKVQQELKNHTSKKGINIKHFYLLEKTKITCGICNRNYFPYKRQNGKDNRYVCTSRRYYMDCGNTGISIDKLNDSVWYFIRRSNDLKDKIEKSIKNSSIKKEIDKVNLDIKKFSDTLVTINNSEKKLVDLYMSELLSLETYESRYKPIKSEKQKVLLDINNLHSKLTGLINFEQGQSNLRNVLKEIKLDIHIMRDYITDIVSSITIHPVSPNDLLSSNKQDKCVLVQLVLFSSLTPINYIISQRSNKILPLIQGEYSTLKRKLTRPIEKDRIKEMLFSTKQITTIQ